MKEFIELIETFPVPPESIYNAWLNGGTHSEMTGGKAICSSSIGGEFSCWDGYITGVNKSLVENKEIVQLWRTSEFKESDEDSILTIQIEAIKDGCEVSLIHKNIPEGHSDYEQGWEEHYFNPMKKYFERHER